MRFSTLYHRASAVEKLDLADKLRTTTKYIYHLATGRRHASASMAQAIERETGGAVRAGELCAACARCPYYAAKPGKKV